ncbi:hypothetical protein CR513_04293, partial [Mucuna pruriens]
MLKRKLETALEEARQERRLSDDFSKKARVEKESRLRIGRCLKAADWEMCSRRVECNQIMAEKEQLKEAVAALKSREVEREDKLHGLREWYNLLALVEARGKAEEAESQLEELKETLEGWKRRCQDIANEAEIQVWAAIADAQFWKDKYIKLAWLANQALMNIPRTLRATEDIVDPTRTQRNTGILRTM